MKYFELIQSLKTRPADTKWAEGGLNSFGRTMLVLGIVNLIIFVSGIAWSKIPSHIPEYFSGVLAVCGALGLLGARKMKDGEGLGIQLGQISVALFSIAIVGWGGFLSWRFLSQDGANFGVHFHVVAVAFISIISAWFLWPAFLAIRYLNKFVIDHRGKIVE